MNRRDFMKLGAGAAAAAAVPALADHPGPVKLPPVQPELELCTETGERLILDTIRRNAPAIRKALS